MRKFFSCIFSFLLSTQAFSQAGVDSLLSVLKASKEDTVKINTLILIANKVGSNDPEKALGYVQQALSIVNTDTAKYYESGYAKYAAQCYRGSGVANYFMGNYEEALPQLKKALQLYDGIKNKGGAANALGWIGNTYYSKGDFTLALDAMLRSLKLHEETNNKTGVGGALNGIANIYRSQRNLQKALEYYHKSLDIRMELKDTLHVAYTYNNIGLVYQEADSLDKALACHFKCMAIVEKFNDKKGMANSYGNLGEVYSQQGKFKEALGFLLKSLHISEEISDKNGICASYNDIGKTYNKLKDHRSAVEFFGKAVQVGKEIGDKDALKDSYLGLAMAYKALDDYANALDNYEMYASYKDSLANEGNLRNLEEMQTRFETEKKEKEIELLQKDRNIRELQISEQEANIHRQRIIIYSVIGGLLLVLALVFMIWKSYREKKRINLGLERKNIEINIQKNQIEEKNILITDSIDYARNIQNAILPTEASIERHLPGTFILFKPKDIVSGDFYWMNTSVEDRVLFAAIDCTGHGVPGAFMSVMAYNMLENIVSEKRLSQPSLILDELNKAVLETLHQDSEGASAKFGMDISLFAVNKQRSHLQFAGAHNPLLLVSANGEIKEIKADRTTIGMAQEKFSDHRIDLSKGDMLYMFTDGYPDQRGGPQNKKFFASEFKKLLGEIAGKETAAQKTALLNTFENWKGMNEQIDDILVSGIRI